MTRKARELVRRRVLVAENAFAEVVVWHLPAPVPGCSHSFKYRLAFVVDGECVLRYGNEAGKGDHRHIGDGEKSYTFSGPRQLMADFSHDIARWRHEYGDDRYS